MSARDAGERWDALAQEALGTGHRPPPASRWSASVTYGWRVLLKIKHVPEELGDAVGIPLLFTVLFTYLFGGALEGSTHAYLQYLLPGTLVLAVVFLSVYSGVNINRDLTTGAYDRFRSLPVWRPAPLVGGQLGDVGRYLLAAALVIGLGFVMGFHAGGGPLGVLGGVALAIGFAVALSWAWIALGLALRSPSAVMSIGFVILMPLGFMSNVFVAPDTLPSWLRTVTDINPITHVVSAERDLMLGTGGADQIGWALLSALALVVIFMPLALRLQARHR